jgi:voltage-gated potassium channel
MPTLAEDNRHTLRRRAYEIIEGTGPDERHSRLFDGAIIALILINIAAFIAETVPSIEHAYGRWLDAFEVFSVAIFTIEYGLRLWTAVEMPFLKRLPPGRARLQLATRPALIIDLLAVLPFYLSFLLPLDLRILRMLRLLRFFKLSRYSPALHTLGRVLNGERRALAAAGLLLMAAVLFASTGIYYLEGTTQPDKFGSVPDAAWWAIATLTTVGYGDVTPVTPAGKMFGAMVMVFGLCILALPVAIISAGFAQEVGRRDFVVTWSLMSRIPMLAELEAAQVAEIMPLLHANNLPPNVEVIAEGSAGEAVYFVASGTVEMRGSAGEARFRSGDVFGVAATLAQDRHSASFVTATRARLLKLYREDLIRLAASNPLLGAEIRRLAEAGGVPGTTRAAPGESGDKGHA